MAHALSKIAEGIATYLATFKSAPPGIRKKVTAMQADAFMKAVTQSRLLQSEADEVKQVVVNLLSDKGFPLKEVHIDIGNS